jgi:quinol monooxygenase YgiN
MGFVQVIEFSTGRMREVEALMDRWVEATQGRRSASRGILARDRDHPDRFVQVVEFPSYEEAMTNSRMPETASFAEKLAGLCTSGPVFKNLDLVRLDAF